MTKKDKLDAINDTINSLNAGTDEAMAHAHRIKKDVLKSGDEKLIKTIEYLWELIWY